MNGWNCDSDELVMHVGCGRFHVRREDFGLITQIFVKGVAFPMPFGLHNFELNTMEQVLSGVLSLAY
jgi:hypothetical protein